jgi:hypothetical protein
MRAISEEECAPLEEHLLVCSACRERLRQADLCVNAFRGAAADVRRESERKGWFSTMFGGGRLVWAVVSVSLAAVLLLVGLEWQARQRNGALPAELALVAMRGAGDHVAAAPAGRPLQLTLDLTGLPPQAAYRVEVVDQRGQRLLETGVPGSAPLVATVPALKPGDYLVRLYSPAQVLLREYSLPVGR